MKFSESYLGKLRATVGHDLVLMPGASILVEDTLKRILLLQRSDDGSWCMPGGAAEVGSSFVSTARTELLEETGIDALPSDLVAFASLSEPEIHTLTYPNGDITHCFAIWFALTGWEEGASDLKTDEESLDLRFFERNALPKPIAPASVRALELFDEFLATGTFQAH